MEFKPAAQEDGNQLAELRALAMRESLEHIGRYNPVRVRERFLSNFLPENTVKVFDENQLIGFYVLIEKVDHYFLDHFYIQPTAQGKGHGSIVIKKIMGVAAEKNKPIRLGALKGSRSNKFYLSHNFRKTHEEEFDNYYESNLDKNKTVSY